MYLLLPLSVVRLSTPRNLEIRQQGSAALITFLHPLSTQMDLLDLLRFKVSCEPNCATLRLSSSPSERSPCVPLALDPVTDAYKLIANSSGTYNLKAEGLLMDAGFAFL